MLFCCRQLVLFRNINNHIYGSFLKPAKLSGTSKSKPLQDIKRRVLDSLDANPADRFRVDTLIYENPRIDFYRYCGIFNLLQYFFFCYGATTLYTLYKRKREKKHPKSGEELLKTLEPIEKLNLLGKLKERRVEVAITASLLLFGHVCAIALGFFCARSVRYIIIRRGGQKVRITCFSVLGLENRYRHHDLAIDAVSCQVHRNAASGYMPLKIKGKSFYFLIDPRGKFYSPTIFDHTVGVFRLLK